ncbi:MAG: DinB family protein [Chloroflexi bacterium]|nr:DinB family protein [Chloroflexota bacterium]
MAIQSCWRLELLARLAAERSYLLRQFWALNEETIHTVPVVDDWTAKDIIAHIAVWDSVILSRIRKVANGRVHTIEPQGEGENQIPFNLNLREKYRTFSLKLVVAFALRERSSLLYAFNQLSDEELERAWLLPWGEEVRLRDWFVQRYKHDAHHAGEMAAWRKTMSLPQKRQIGPKLILRAILKASRKEFVTLVDLMPEADRSRLPVSRHWTLKDLVGHLADWEQIGVDGLNQLLLGQKPELAPIDDFDIFDQAGVAARRRQDWRRIWREFNDTRQTLDDVFQKYPEPFLQHTLTTPWGRKMPAYFWLATVFGHDIEHAIDIRRALNLTNWPERLTLRPKRG